MAYFNSGRNVLEMQKWKDIFLEQKILYARKLHAIKQGS